MNLLAIDTATEQCSVALVTKDRSWSRAEPTARSHADLILPMIEGVLKDAGVLFAELDGLAFGRGPGSFTGVRIAVGVIQGLALARNLPVIGVSNLAAVAQQVANEQRLSLDAQILVCMDARMQEVYWARYRVAEQRLVQLLGEERVGKPDDVHVAADELRFGVGTGWRAYPILRTRFPQLAIAENVLPRAIEIAQLAIAELVAGRGVRAADAQPVYLRDRVVATRE